MGKRLFSTALLILAASTCFSSHAQQVFPETWGDDGCLYVADGAAWWNSMWCRKFPDDENTNVWDLYNAQKILVYRFTYDDSGWIQMYEHQSELTYLVPNRNSVLSAMAAVSDFSKVLVLWPDDQWLSPLVMTAVEHQQLHAAIRNGIAELRASGPECLRGTYPSTVRYSIPTNVECQTDAERKRMYEMASNQVGMLESQQQQDASRQACQSELGNGAYDATGERCSARSQYLHVFRLAHGPTKNRPIPDTELESVHRRGPTAQAAHRPAGQRVRLFDRRSRESRIAGTLECSRLCCCDVFWHRHAHFETVFRQRLPPG